MFGYPLSHPLSTTVVTPVDNYLAPTYHPTKIFLLSHTNRFTHLILICTTLTINILKRTSGDTDYRTIFNSLFDTNKPAYLVEFEHIITIKKMFQ